MGWTFSGSWNTREKMVAQLERDLPAGSKHRLVVEKGQSVLWSLCPFKDGKIIVCDLLEPSPNGWGYKGMDETMGPYYYSCPLEFLEETDNSVYKNDEWRLGVIQYNSKLNKAC